MVFDVNGAIVTAGSALLGVFVGGIINYYFLSKLNKKEFEIKQIQRMKTILANFRYIYFQLYISVVNKFPQYPLTPLSEGEKIEFRKSILRDMSLIKGELSTLSKTKGFAEEIQLVRTNASKLFESLYEKTSGFTKSIPPDEDIEKKYMDLMEKIDKILEYTIDVDRSEKI